MEAIISALIGLVGVVVGGTLVILNSRLGSRLQFSANAWEPILEKRLSAFHSILETANDLRMTTSTGPHDQKGQLRTYPIILENKESFFTWHDKYSLRQLEWDDWVDTSTRRHMNYLTDLFINIRIFLEGMEDEKLGEFRETALQDFLSNAVRTRDAADRFFAIIDKKRFPRRRWHKYPRWKTDWLLRRSPVMKYIEAQTQGQ